MAQHVIELCSTNDSNELANESGEFNWAKIGDKWW